MIAALLALVILLTVTACSVLPHPRTSADAPTREFTTTVVLHGKSLDLHVSTPLASTLQAAPLPDVVVLYASGDGGWFGAAKEMFRDIADAGYPVVGFSSRAFLRIERPRGALVSAAQLAAEYALIVAQARVALGLGDSTRVVLAGWSRGAAFSVLAGSEPPMRRDVQGVIAIGLTEGEDLQAGDAGDEPDPASATPAATSAKGARHWPFDTYARIGQLAPISCAVIQATKDGYLPAASARERFGVDTPARRFYAVEARNHRFSGGRAAFTAALVDALRWISTSPR